MTAALQVKTPAKLNLMLHITGQRADGYHELQTVFQFIALYDELSFEATEDGLIRRIDSNSPVAEQDDLIIRAAQLMQRTYSISKGVTIRCQKTIPMGGGLGGGSSDAAATLMALNRLWSVGLDSEELQKIGAQLGADVPIFIFAKNAWAEGIGEQLTELSLPKTWYLIIHPQIFVSTAQIFASKDLTRDCHPLTIRAFLEGKGRNVCQPVAVKLYPQIQKAIDWLDQFSPARMTGTGACVFAAFDNEAQASTILQQLPSEWAGYVAKSLHENPVKTACSISG